MKRVFLIVLDSYGCGAMPDADKFGDAGVSTINSVASSEFFNAPNLRKMGLYNLDGVTLGPKEDSPSALHCRMKEVSMGKDTTIGHWEIAGIQSEFPLPTYPDGFPEEVLAEFTKQTGRGALCNKPYSGTGVINEYGDEHVKSGDLIAYTSADSVFQIAAHEKYFGLDRLYEVCQIAFEEVKLYHIGRVIARPFEGEKAGEFVRTKNRHDYSVTPPKKTLLDVVKDSGKEVVAIGKISDIYAGCGVTKKILASGLEELWDKTLEAMKDTPDSSLIFTNFVDFDMLYGHRRDVEGYKQALEYFDSRLPEFVAVMQKDDVAFVVADHGNDPTYKGTDHTREQIPVLMFGPQVKQENIGQRETFADIGQTAAAVLGLKLQEGKSFL
ncbi:MAG: phosphopentomutase [Alphaproteobacteria bacterium]|nr:phosphopentomutase [Alphaproteobacteria bacterium]